MSDLQIIVPAQLVRQLDKKNIPQEKILETVTRTVIRALEELAVGAPAPHDKPNKTNNTSLRAGVGARASSSTPSMNDPFIGGLTVGEWLAMTDAEQEQVWTKLEEKEWKKLEKKYGDGVDVKLKPRSPRQERGAQLSLRARETRAHYTTHKRRTSRVRTAKR